MPLSKDDAPASAKPITKAQKEDAVEDLIDSGAGAPPAQREAAEELPEGDVVKDAIKASLLATDAQTEAKEKAKVVEDSSVGSQDTPSGYALLKTAGIADDIERGEEYARIKSAKRWGYVPATDKDLEVKK
jgi:hypothetical protein